MADMSAVEKLLEQRRAAAAGGAAPPPNTPEPPLPAAAEPDVTAAQSAFRRAANETAIVRGDAPGSALATEELARRIVGPPPTMGEKPTLGEQAIRSLTPHSVATDNRPLSEVAGEYARRFAVESGIGQPKLSAAVMIDSLAGWYYGEDYERPEAFTQAFGEIDQVARDRTSDPETKGLPTETSLLGAMRVLGTAASATVQETALRLPVGIDDDWTAYTVGQLIGADPTELQRVRRDDGWLGEMPGGADWMQGILERIEYGRGLEGDLPRVAASVGGNESDQKLAWWVGLGIDTLTNWEGIVAKPAKVAAATARTTRALGDLVPDATLVERVKAAALDNEVDLAEWVTRKQMQRVERPVEQAPNPDGTPRSPEPAGIDALPPALRARAEEVALTEHGETLDELAQAEGFGYGSRSTLADDVAHRTELEQAGRRAMDEMGVEEFETPDGAVFSARKVKKERAAPLKEDRRPVLPEFMWDGRIVEPATAAAWWDEVRRIYQRAGNPAGGYKLPAHLGYERLAGRADQAPDVPNYQLRNNRGDVVAEGDMYVVTDRMLKRQRDGDEIWWGVQRPVARWSQKNGVKLTYDRLFASRVERRVVELTRGSDPRAIPARLRQLREQAARELPRAVGTKLLEAAAQDAPNPVRGRLGQVVRDAARLEVRDLYGSDDLVMLPGGALVTRGDRKRIIDGVQRRMRIPAERQKALIEGADPTEAERLRLTELGRRAGIPAERVFPLTSEVQLAIHRQAVREEAGVLADARYGVRGTKPFVDRVLEVVRSTGQNRLVWSKAGQAVVDGFFGKFLKWTMGRTVDNLAPRLQALWRELGVRLERNADDLLDEYKALDADASPAAKMITLSGRYSRVTPGQLRIARSLRQSVATPVDVPDVPLAGVARAAKDLEGVPGVDGAALSAEDAATAAANARRQAFVEQQRTLRDELRHEWVGPRPRWLTEEDPGIYLPGLARWSRETIADAAAAGRRWIDAAALSVSGKVSKRDSILLVLEEKVDDALAVQVYEDLHYAGALDSPALREALTRADVKVDAELDVRRALLYHVLDQRAQHLIAETVDRALYDGLLVRQTDPRHSALNALIQGTERTYNHELGVWESRFPEAQLTWARQQLREWGMESGAQGAGLDAVRVGNRPVFVPHQLARDLGDLVQRAMVDSRSLGWGKAYDMLMQTYKESVTHGVLLPNPAYFTGQMIGIPHTMWSTIGARGTVQTGGAFLEHRPMVGAVMKRINEGGVHPERGVPQHVVTDDGRVVSLDQIAGAAKRAGLGDTPASYETATRFESAVLRDGPDYAWMDPRRTWASAAPQVGGRAVRTAANAARGWQETIRKFAGSFDQAAKLSYMIGEVKRGASLDDAAMRARRATLDFRDVSDFDRAARRVFTFWSFLRKNADAQTYALFKHPERLGQQMRAWDAFFDYGPLSSVEAAGIDENDLSRQVLYWTDEVTTPSGRVDPRYRIKALTTTPISVAEWLLSMRSFLAPVAVLAGWGNAETDAQYLLQQIGPVFQAAALTTAGRKLDAEVLGSARVNRIPPVLLDLPGIGPAMWEWFRVGPVPIESWEHGVIEDHDATVEYGGGHPAVWAAGAYGTEEERRAARVRWQLAKTWIARPLQTGVQLSQTLGLSEPPPTQTWGETAAAFLLGVNWRPIPTEEEVRRRFEEQQVRDLKANQRLQEQDRPKPALPRLQR